MRRTHARSVVAALVAAVGAGSVLSRGGGKGR